MQWRSAKREIDGQTRRPRVDRTGKQSSRISMFILSGKPIPIVEIVDRKLSSFGGNTCHFVPRLSRITRVEEHFNVVTDNYGQVKRDTFEWISSFLFYDIVVPAYAFSDALFDRPKNVSKFASNLLTDYRNTDHYWRFFDLGIRRGTVAFSSQPDLEPDGGGRRSLADIYKLHQRRETEGPNRLGVFQRLLSLFGSRPNSRKTSTASFSGKAERTFSFQSKVIWGVLKFHSSQTVQNSDGKGLNQMEIVSQSCRSSVSTAGSHGLHRWFGAGHESCVYLSGECPRHSFASSSVLLRTNN